MPQETWIDPLPRHAWNALTEEERRAHIATREERQDLAAELITGRGIEILLQTSGAFRGDWDYGDFNDSDAWCAALIDVVLSLQFHDAPPATPPPA